MSLHLCDNKTNYIQNIEKYSSIEFINNTACICEQHEPQKNGMCRERTRATFNHKFDSSRFSIIELMFSKCIKALRYGNILEIIGFIPSLSLLTFVYLYFTCSTEYICL